MATKEDILRQLRSASNEIAKEFDVAYGADLEVFAEELAVSYTILLDVIKSDDKLPANDFQGALIYWGALNTILGSIELLRRGYTNEPQVLMRNALEAFAVAWDFHVNPERYKEFMANVERFKSTLSITTASKVHKIIGEWYGLLSQVFTHIRHAHSLPHKVRDRLYVGGRFESDDQAVTKMCVVMIMGNIDVLNSLLELTFIVRITKPRFWEKTSVDTYKYTPNNTRMTKIMNKVKESVNSLEKED